MGERGRERESESEVRGTACVRRGGGGRGLFDVPETGPCATGSYRATKLGAFYKTGHFMTQMYGIKHMYSKNKKVRSITPGSS